MSAIILFVHIAVCVLLILIILLQVGKGAGLGNFLGGGSDAIVTTSGGNVLLRKITAVLAIIFACTSLMLTVFSKRQPISSLLLRQGMHIPQTAPALPAPEPDTQSAEEPVSAPAQP